MKTMINSREFETSLSGKLYLVTGRHCKLSMGNFIGRLFPLGERDSYLRYEYTKKMLSQDVYPQGIVEMFGTDKEVVCSQLESFVSLLNGWETELQHGMLTALQNIQSTEYSPKCVSNLIEYISNGEFTKSKAIESLYYYLFLAIRKNLPHTLEAFSQQASVTDFENLSVENSISFLENMVRKMPAQQAPKAILSLLNILYSLTCENSDQFNDGMVPLKVR